MARLTDVSVGKRVRVKESQLVLCGYIDKLLSPKEHHGKLWFAEIRLDSGRKGKYPISRLEVL